MMELAYLVYDGTLLIIVRHMYVKGIVYEFCGDGTVDRLDYSGYYLRVFLLPCRVCSLFHLLLVLILFFVQRIPVVYFEKEEFPEIEDFMREVSKTHGFEFLKYALSYKDGMQDLVDNHGVKVRRILLRIK